MEKTMKRATVLTLLSATALWLLYLWLSGPVLLGLTIAAGTTAYHFAMRMLVGTCYDRLLHNQMDHTARWFRVGPREMALYRLIRIKRWKKYLPTYDPDAFSPQKHSWEEIAQATCQSELVHETIALLSFLPVAAAGWFGAFPVFFVSSVLSAAFDSLFVLLQRYNRCRIQALLKKQESKSVSTVGN